jgi:hypothetical protein
MRTAWAGSSGDVSCYSDRQDMAKKSRPRAQRREGERALAKLKDARQRLFELEVGGAPERPLPVVSATVVETHAESVPCPRCNGKHEVVEHVAVTVAGIRLREARLRCRQCGTSRSLWFRINDGGPN